MALNTKKSRLIIVDSAEYRYIVSQAKTHTKGVFDLSLTVQSAAGQGAKLLVSTHTRDFWLDRTDVPRTQAHFSALPKRIAQIIRLGIESGWNPEAEGKPFVLKVDYI